MAGQDGIALTIVSRFDGRRWCRRLESGADERELGGPAGVRQEPEVADAAEALWQNVEQKATDELIGFERHHLGLVVVTIVLPTEADMAILAGEQPAVGDRDPMGVAPEISENLLGASERPLGVDDPFDLAQHVEMADERRRRGEVREMTEELELCRVGRRLQVLEEQTAIEPRQNAHRKEEARPATNPAPIGGKAAARHEAMSVGMMRQRLAPGVEDGDHPGLGTEVPGINGDTADRFGGHLQQNVVDDRLVLQRDGGDGCRHRKDDMEVGNGQQVGLTIGKPLGARQTLALRAVPVAAAVVGDADLTAIVALFDVTAERRGAARLDGRHDAALVGQEPTTLRDAERLAVAAEDVRHLQYGTHEAALLGRDNLQGQRVERTRCSGDQAGRDLGVTSRRLQMGVTEQDLDDPDVGTAF